MRDDDDDVIEGEFIDITPPPAPPPPPMPVAIDVPGIQAPPIAPQPKERY